MYQLIYTDEARLDLERQTKARIFRRIHLFEDEMRQHPLTGSGSVEKLNWLENTYSRRIFKGHRLVYKVDEEKSLVTIISAYGHYNHGEHR